MRWRGKIAPRSISIWRHLPSLRHWSPTLPRYTRTNNRVLWLESSCLAYHAKETCLKQLSLGVRCTCRRHGLPVSGASPYALEPDQNIPHTRQVQSRVGRLVFGDSNCKTWHPDSRFFGFSHLIPGAELTAHTGYDRRRTFLRQTEKLDHSSSDKT